MKFVGNIYFIRLGKRWPELMLQWETVEKRSPRYTKKKINYRFFKTIRAFAVIMMIVIHSKNRIFYQRALILRNGRLSVEHAMSKTAGFLRSVQCNGKGTLQGYVTQAWPQINIIFGPQEDGHIAFVIEAINYYCTFMWSYMDLFITAISICLANRLRQFNHNLRRFKGLSMHSAFWLQQRNYFSELSQLIALVDENISIITVLSLSNNFYFILVQLLHSFE